MGSLSLMTEPLPAERGFATRWLTAGFYAIVLFVVAIVGVMLVQLIAAGWWWELPIIAVLAYFTFVLFRQRLRH
jgi:hypothetical protein